MWPGGKHKVGEVEQKEAVWYLYIINVAPLTVHLALFGPSKVGALKL